MTITVQQILDNYADGMRETDFAAALAAELAERAAPRAVELTDKERATLITAGVNPRDLDPEPGAASRAARNTADALIDAAATSFSVSDAAIGLGVDPSRVRHRISDRSLYALKLGTKLRLPHWQFGDSPATPGRLEVLPHLRRILGAVPPAATPFEIATFMTSGQVELQLSGSAVTPREWLLAGQSPDPICEMLTGLYQW